MYSQKAFDILNASINNAVFIDEKAKDFYSGTDIDEKVPEEKLSFDLYTTFKTNGKNLTVHKFENTNINEPKTIEYLFKGKDLILLDWELDGVSGQEHSLNLLHKAVSSPNINFCCIYSSAQNFDDISLFLDAYFSGISKENFQIISDVYSFFEEDDLKDTINKSQDDIQEFANENSIDFSAFPIKEFENNAIEYLFRLIHIALNIDKFYYSDGISPKYEVFNAGNNSFMINNTFVLTLKKDFNKDLNYESLIRRISDIVITNEGSFFQLLGLEMQSIFNDNESFIDSSILKSSTEALFQFRNHLNDDKSFGTIIKKLLLEQATLKFRTAKLKLLESDFLQNQSSKLANTPPTNEDLFQLNVFYNSVTVSGMHDSIPNLNFGDVFVDVKGDYFLCITALCDCFDPNKIQGNFYFVKGKQFKNIDLALRLGDTAFLSFLPNNIAVYWGNLDSARFNSIERQRQGESMDAYRIRKLTNEIDGYKQFLYKPFYVKPQIFNVESNKLIDKKLRMWDISNKYKEEEIDQNLNEFNLSYITTLRQDYAQRIANHAFGHPARVGVDFVKIY
ncbi:response regulator receiver domain [Myroides odoratus]|uniref:response regulator receiver domain n=1 Tax=Myroides odoratus TaxID=256 RepID=UPI0007658AC0|nr:response regulator receiver domain [Myroides odoratus]